MSRRVAKNYPHNDTMPSMELSDVIGQHPVLSVSTYSINSTGLPEVIIRKDEPLGTIRIDQTTLSCPMGDFSIVGIKSDPKSESIGLALKELSAEKKCSIMKGGPYGRGGTFLLMFQMHLGFESYKFVVEPLERPESDAECRGAI